MSYESKTPYLQGRGSVSSGEGNANNAAYLMKNESVWPPQDEEKWAYSLVGRWWEVFWESSSPLEEKSNNASNGEECLNKYTPSGEITQQSLQHNQQQYHLIQSNPLSHQQLSREILFDVTYETAQLKLVLETCGGKLTVSNVLEGAPNSHLIKVGDVIVGINGNPFPPIEQDRDCKAAISLVKETPRPMIVTFQRLQKYEVQHKITPALTSPATPASNPSHNDVSETKQLLSSIKMLQTHANTFLAKGMDEITIPISELGEGWLMRVVARKEPQANYPCPDRFFISPSGKLLRSIAELESFLKNSSTNISTDSGSDDDDENIPLCVLAERQQKQQQHNKKRQNGKRNHTDDNSEDEEDEPDWYDAKIKSYNNGEFVVHFLGDEDDVTYTMPLKPSIVRPSTRAWGRRSLALLTFRDCWSCDRTRNSNQSNIDELIKNSTFDSFSSWLKQVKESLPPSTDLPDDGLRENSLQDNWGDRNTKNMSIGFRKIQEYRRLLVDQTKLCMRLSPPHNEDESCDDDDDATSDEEGPGPYADSSYIDHLNRCLIATSEACEWLLNDSTLWDLLKKVSMVQHIDTFSVQGTGAKSNLSEGQVVEATAPLLSKENLQGIVVAGAKALHQILITCDLSRIGSVLSKQSQKVKRTTKRNRRLEINHETLYNGNISGERFGSLFATAPSSQESMTILITEILKVSSDVQNRNFIQSSMLSVLSFMYENVWKPLVNWIETAEDMDLRKSDNFFSFEEVDFHKRAAENLGYLRLIDLSPWTSKLENKLRRARHFEVEAWSAIKACTQLDGGTPGISTNPCQDQCLLLLRRLKKEAATVPHGDGATGNRSITNLNPLGGQSISPQGVPISSSLTRAVIDDAIVTRAWVVDFIHAKTVRERVSFVEDVIRRYVTLPQLPALPLAFAGIGIHEVVSPSSVLAQNTKDSITILSANAYSYNHIIGNFASRLQTDFSLRNKSGISMALEELKKLPILSVIEEKLIIRDELIGWNDEALQMIGFSATYKCPFSRIESLHTKLMNILHGKTEGRERILQNIRYNEAIEREVISFVVDDEETICPISGPWVRTQYKMGNEWKINSSSIIESLRCYGFFSSLSPACAGKFSTSVLVDPPLQKRRPPTPPTKHKHEEHSLCQTHQQMQQQQQQPQQSAPTKVTLESISKLLEIHDGSELASSYPEEYKLLNNIKQYSFEWSSRVKQIVSSESLSIAERGNKLIEILAQKPVGVEMHPTVDDINLWCKVYSWLNNLNQGMDSLMDQLGMWKDGSVSSVSRFGNSEREVLVGLTSAHMSSIIEGQEFLTPISKNSIPRIVSELKDEILRDFDAVGEKDVQVISKKDVLESKFPMDVIMGSDEDRKIESPLFICQCLVWRLICDRFLSRIQQYLAAKNGELSSGKKPSLKDAKAILSFCPVTMSSFFPLSDIIILKVKKSFQQMVEDAEALQTRASQTLDDCTSLLQTNCFMRKDDICRSLQVLKNIQVDLVRHENSTIGALLNIDTKVAISRKVTNVEWLVKCFSYPAIFMENTVLVSSLDSEQDQNKIPFSQLEKLCDSIPVEPGVQWNETCGVVDTEILRISHVVRNLFQSACRWQSAVSALLPYSSKGQEMILDEVRQPALELTDLEEIVKNNVLSKVKMPQMTTVRNVITLAREIKARLENELLCIEFMSTDVNKSRFPDDKSLVGKNGDFLLYRLTGSEIYACLRERLRSISETAQRLTVLTQEKLAFQWLVEVFLWVEEIEKAVTDYSSLDGYKRTRLFLNFKSARRILMKGENIFFNIEDVTKEILRAQKISIRLTPQRIAVVVLKGGVANSPGAHLLRWGALLYGCIKSDVDRAEDWEHRVSIAIETYKSFSLDGSISHLGNATRFRGNVENLIDEAVNDLTIQNEEAFQILRDLREKIECSDLVKKQMQIEQVNIEEEEFQVEIERYENPRNVAFARFEVLDCILKRLPPCHEDDSDPGTIFDSLNASSIFEQSVRDKSRLFLEKSLVKGMETFGIESSQVDARDFCSLLAMNLENAIFDKFKSTKETISNEYRDKIRSLRFNLQDPKNPLLCARVLSGDIKIPNLIAMSSDELASKEIKQMRQQVKEESIKNVVISPSSQVKDPVTVDWGSRDISIDEFSNSSKPAPLLSTGKETPRQSPSPVSNEKPPVHIPLPVLSSGVQSYESLSSSADGSSGSTNTEFVRKPPFESAEPTRKNSSPTDYGSSSGQHPKKGSNSVAMTYSAPPALSPPEHEVEDFLTNLPSPIITPSTQNHGRHITSQSGTETFTITISRLKVSFTTKMFIERTCPWELNGFLPSDLADKGRISIEEFNKFISEKMKSGKWTLIHLKLSSIIGESNKTSYKRFYKEYESIDRICMIPVSDDGTKVFLVTPKFLRIIKCMSSVENLSRTNTYVVVLTKQQLPQRYQSPVVRTKGISNADSSVPMAPYGANL